MSCIRSINDPSEPYLRADAEIDCECECKMSPGERAKHTVKVWYDGPTSRLVTVVSTCEGPLLGFGEGKQACILASEATVVNPARKEEEEDFFPFSTDITCSEPTNETMLPSREVVCVNVSSTNLKGRFRGRLGPTHLTVSLGRHGPPVLTIPQPRR